MSGNLAGKKPSVQNGGSSGRAGGQVDHADHADELRQSIYGSAQTIRSLMLFVLISVAYVLIVIGLTTDMMLLREEAVVLPFIQVGVPVVAFYVVAPLLILFLHFNLLARLTLLARDIRACFGDIHSQPIAPNADGLFETTLTMLFPIDPVRLMLDMRKVTFERVALDIVFLIQVTTVPLLVLLILQARFLAYQDEWITLFHQIAVTVDLFFQFLFILSFSRLWGGGKKFLRTPRYLIVSVLIAIPAFYAWAVALVPDGYIENKVKSDWQQSIAGCFFPDWWKKYEGDLFSCNFLEGERFINVQSEIITLKDVPPEVVGALVQAGEKPAREIPCEHIGELRLSERRLFYANFSDSRFKCVEMKNAQLHRAKLVGTRLNGIDLQGAELRGADLRLAELNGADLRDAEFNYANLSNAELNHADLRGAGLNGADFRNAGLNKADLRDASLHGADLRASDLHGADLRKSELHGAKLRSSELHGAELSGAQLYGADLSWAELHSADLSWAELHGTDLYGAELHGANLSGAQLYGANLYETQLYDTKLSNTELHGANLSGAKLHNTSLSEVDGEMPNRKRWLNILGNVKRGLKEVGYTESEIAARLATIKRNGASTPGFVLPSVVSD